MHIFRSTPGTERDIERWDVPTIQPINKINVSLFRSKNRKLFSRLKRVINHFNRKHIL